jgi:hypothetical protein
MWPVGLLSLLSAVFWLCWCLRLWRDPTLLKPDSLMYRVYVAWLRALRLDLWGKSPEPIVLTVEELQFFALLQVVGAILLLVSGVGLMIVDWLSG